MAATLNIRRVCLISSWNLGVQSLHLILYSQDVSDAFYRYKMERLQSKIEGKGNGIKTVIVNLSSVSQSLSRPPSCE